MEIWGMEKLNLCLNIRMFLTENLTETCSYYWTYQNLTVINVTIQNIMYVRILEPGSRKMTFMRMRIGQSHCYYYWPYAT